VNLLFEGSKKSLLGGHFMKTVNRKFKSSVFSFVFSNPDVLRELYCATVQYCKKHDILKELIEKYAKEIMSMLTTEWNWDTANRLRFPDIMFHK
jgi:hypothetical protein